MRALIDDAIDLVRLRAKPLAEYRYPSWQLYVVLLLIGLTNSAGADSFTGPLLARIVFFTVFNGLETVLMAAVMRSWLRFGGWRDDASLWPLVVLAGSLQVLEPLTSWLDSDLELALAALLSIYTLLVLIVTVSQATGMPRWRVAVGVLLFLPVGALLLSLMLSLATELDWVTLPTDPPSAAPAASAER